MTDTKQICEAIKGLPDNDRLQLHVRPTYKSDEWGMNRYLTTESDASIATDDLKALVAENKALKEEIKDFMCDPSFDCQQCEPLRTRYFDGGNDGQR